MSKRAKKKKVQQQQSQESEDADNHVNDYNDKLKVTFKSHSYDHARGNHNSINIFLDDKLSLKDILSKDFIDFSLDISPPSAERLFELFFRDEIYPFILKANKHLANQMQKRKEIHKLWPLQKPELKEVYSERSRLLHLEWHRRAKESKEKKKTVSNKSLIREIEESLLLTTCSDNNNNNNNNPGTENKEKNKEEGKEEKKSNDRWKKELEAKIASGDFEIPGLKEEEEAKKKKRSEAIQLQKERRERQRLREKEQRERIKKRREKKKKKSLFPKIKCIESKIGFSIKIAGFEESFTNDKSDKIEKLVCYLKGLSNGQLNEIVKMKLMLKIEGKHDLERLFLDTDHKQVSLSYLSSKNANLISLGELENANHLFDLKWKNLRFHSNVVFYVDDMNINASFSHATQMLSVTIPMKCKR